MRGFKGIILGIMIMVLQPLIEVEATIRTKEIEAEIQSKDDTMIETLDEFLSKKIQVEKEEIIGTQTLNNSKIKIINKNLKWNGNLDLTNKPKKIVMHHIEASRANSNIGVEEVHQWHKNNGWAGIGYHFYINKKGEIYIGRPENAIGAHALNNNIDTLGIAVEGKYETESMPNIQKQAVELLGKYLRQKYGIGVVNKHQDLVATSCPGKNYPFTEVKNSILEEKLDDNGIYSWIKENDRMFLLDTWRNIYEEGQVNYKGKIYNVSSTKGVLDTGFLILDNDRYYMKSNNTYAKEWLKVDDDWYYFGQDGIARSNWNFISGKWYYFDENTIMKTGWLLQGNDWYHLNSSGEMNQGWVRDQDWYYMGEDGKMIKGWFFTDGWYYTDINSGKMQNDWLLDGGKWYYLNKSGKMIKEWTWIGEKWYYFNHSGIMQTGWRKEDSNWYYLNGGGDMAIGWICENHKWYYFNYSGIMQTGWNFIEGKWYYLNSNGIMATNVIIDGWKIGYDGVAIKIA